MLDVRFANILHLKKSYFLIVFNVTIVICFHSENVTDLMASGSPLLSFELVFAFWHKKTFQTLVVFHPLELAVSPRSLVSSSGRRYLEAKISALGVHISIGLFPALSVALCRHTHKHTHTHALILHLFLLYIFLSTQAERPAIRN